MRLPQIQIQSMPARIDIRSQQGRFDIRQQPAVMDIKSTRTVIDVEWERPEVLFDMTKTWEALNGGGNLAFMNRIYNQSGQFVLQSIQNTVSEYDRIGDLPTDGSAIAAIAKESMYRQPPKLQMYGEASVLNLSFDPRISKPQVQVRPGDVNISITPSKPEINYQRGNVNIEMAQYPAVQITSPQIDLTV
ncbi:hypothetical protein PAT3040_01741 [Paenibacillus agaridevorans]|uniref:Uncharacterized protein n=1 Tax=Paenibacillus agaridevorans TaxID=171404 RepID=A0A2R5ETT2_9BACL|nr:DUF6470 family protein [Paenibacillus agaridevorans]GBG07193.1 hypothetical protein PAT3040_01741 [Paenibacillus agaridevorans]